MDGGRKIKILIVKTKRLKIYHFNVMLCNYLIFKYFILNFNLLIIILEFLNVMRKNVKMIVNNLIVKKMIGLLRVFLMLNIESQCNS